MAKFLRRATLKKNMQAIRISDMKLTLPSCTHIFDHIIVECKRGKTSKTFEIKGDPLLGPGKNECLLPEVQYL